MDEPVVNSKGLRSPIKDEEPTLMEFYSEVLRAAWEMFQVEAKISPHTKASIELNNAENEAEVLGCNIDAANKCINRAKEDLSLNKNRLYVLKHALENELITRGQFRKLAYQVIRNRQELENTIKQEEEKIQRALRRKITCETTASLIRKNYNDRVEPTGSDSLGF